MIRVGIDAQIADVSRAGIGQVTRSIVRWLPVVDRDATYVELRPNQREKDFSMPGRLWWDQVALPRLASRHNLSVVLKPGFSVPVRSKVPTVVMLHDLAARRFPHELHRPSAWFYGRWAPWSIRFARLVIAASRFTAEEAQKLLGLPSERIRVVYQGIDLGEREAARDAVLERCRGLPTKFLLHVGTIEPRKNLAFLLRVFSKFLLSHPEYHLLLAGKEGWLSADVRKTMERLDLKQSVHIFGEVSDEEREVLYRRARAVVFPSKYEGFGRPPLEAMAAETPVIAAASGATPEVVGDAALLIQGYDESTWVAGLERIADDEELRGTLRTRGMSRCQRFTWERASREISVILHEVAHG